MNIYSSVSRNQEASLHAIETFNTVWVIDSCDPNDRFERQGEPVRAGDPILIRHCHTQQYLASDLVVEKNDFGQEYEVSTHSFALANKTQNLELEKKGNITTDVPTRF
jgi:dolichyl-phosphate-mannose--protein O-mannosyl transferase